MNYYSENLLPKNKEVKKNYHRTRFIVYLALWLCSGLIWLISLFLGFFTGGFLGLLIGWIAGIILTVSFFVLGIYHLIKWLNV